MSFTKGEGHATDIAQPSIQIINKGNDMNTIDYTEFLERKKVKPIISGFDISAESLNHNLFDFQRVIVKWALKRGRAAIFADTGLGKTLMQTSWADEVVKNTKGNVMIFAPLCVAQQTVREGEKFGIAINYCRTPDQVKSGINISNYEMLENFDLSQFAGVVLDESSIIKNREGKTRNAMIESCQQVPYRLSCTATPSPNDFMELGNQCEFLGIMTMTEMLATYFINDAGDTGTWILKGHARVKFWEWLSTWACVIRSPNDLGFDGSAYVLPQLNMFEHVVESEATTDLFANIATGLLERNQARKESIDDRVAKCYEVICIHSKENDIITSLNLNGDENGKEKHKQFGLHEAIQGEEFREMEENSRTAGGCECKAQGKVCDRCGIQSIRTFESEGIQSTESKCKKESKNKSSVQLNDRTIQSDARELQSSMSDMRILGERTQNKIPTYRPLPQEKQSEGNTLLELQSGDREVYGQSRSASKGDRLFKEQWVIWCHRNEEQEKLEKLFGDDCFSVYGTLSLDEKEKRVSAWVNNERAILISKPSVLGSGMNFQNCHNTAFVGLSDSWEQYYQAIRRFYRFGQTHQVNVHVISAESEGAVVANIKRKEEQNALMGAEMVKHMSESMKHEIFGATMIKDEYIRDVYHGDGWTIHNADCIDLAREIESNSIDFTIYSPPFDSLFTYSNSDRDMGNNKKGEFIQHFGYLVDEMYRITRPGRLMAVHCMNLPTSKVNDGFIGIRDFRGELIRLFQEKGWIYHSEVCIWKDPVVAMQRTKALGLLHKTIKKDSSMSRQGLADYLVVMRKDGVNDKPISHTAEEFPVEMWQKYASPVWFDIDQSRTLNFRDARDDDDVKHICPLQLDVIERAMDLWTAPNDLVFSPFTGVGSEGYTAVKMGRRFIGSELKRSYFEQAVKNICDLKKQTQDLFAA